MLKKLCLLLLLLNTISACSYDEGTEVATTGVPGIGRRGPETVGSVDEVGGVNDDGDLANLNSGDNNGGAGDGTDTQEYLTSKVGDRVYFALDSSNLSSEGQQTLDRQANWMNSHPNLKVTIEGHSDERGTREYNLALADRRATTIKNYLSSHGVNAERINTVSYGKERPVAFGSDEQSWTQNRRGVTVLN